MGLSQSLFGEGQNMTPAQMAQAQAQAQAAGQTVAAWNTGSNTGGPQGNGLTYGNDLSGNEVSTSTPSVNSGLYANAMNLANAQAQNYQQKGNAALGVAAPTMRNANGAAVQGQIAGINRGYGQLDAGLSRVANGGGINAGQAQYQQGQDASIANAMSAAHMRGSGGMQGQLGAASNGLGNAQMAGANARGQQIATAQGGLSNAYAQQGGMNLQNAGNQQAFGTSQAQLQAAQNAQNSQQALNLYGLSQAQQGAAASDLQQYNTQAINTENAGTAHQQTQNNQFGTELGAGLTAGGAVIAAA